MLNRRNSLLLAGVVGVVAAIGAAAAFSGGDDEPSPSTTSTTTTSTSTTTTTIAFGPTAPLTGLAIAQDLAENLQRPALAVKIHNQPEASPQAGLRDADIVYEEVIASAYTRLIAVYHSADAPVVGPVRSARTSDIPILANLNSPGLAHSGANEGTLRAIFNSSLIGISDTRGIYYRDPERPGAPHDLMTSTEGLRELLGDRGGIPKAIFTYRSEGEVPRGSGIAGARLGVTDDFIVDVAWDEERQEWLRWQRGSQFPGEPQVEVYDGGVSDGKRQQVGAANIVLMDIPYVTSSADPRSPEASPIGEGVAWLLSGGRVAEGLWRRPDATSPWQLLENGGEVIGLTPGRTWVILARTGSFEALSPGRVAELPPGPESPGG